MNNNNYNQQNDSGDYGRRYRDESRTPSRYDSQDNFDVAEPVRRRPQEPYNSREANYDYSSRQYYQDNGGMNNRRPQQYDQGYQQGGYYNRQPQQRPQQYNDGYRDGYNAQYSNRPAGYYDRRYNDGYSNNNGRRKAKAPKKKSSPVAVTIRVIAIILLIAGLGIVGYKVYEYAKEGQGHKELQALSADFDQLYERNNDFFGWLKIDGTDIDYPVMYSPDEPERYLHMDFDWEYSESGELFMDANSDPNGYHYLIYGHHMFNGSMFGSLPKFEDTDYFTQHRTFRFDTRSEKGEYEIFAVFYSQIYDENDDVFKYYDHPSLNSEDEYNTYIANVKAMSIYDTGVTPVYGEKIVTMSTCNYHTDDGRFVVCGRKIN